MSPFVANSNLVGTSIAAVFSTKIVAVSVRLRLVADLSVWASDITAPAGRFSNDAGLAEAADWLRIAMLLRSSAAGDDDAIAAVSPPEGSEIPLASPALLLLVVNTSELASEPPGAMNCGVIRRRPPFVFVSSCRITAVAAGPPVGWTAAGRASAAVRWFTRLADVSCESAVGAFGADSSAS